MQQIDVIKIYTQKVCLVIDDFTEVRASLKRMLKEFGCTHIDTAATAPQAISLCKARSYDIVLCDYNLGSGKDGQQVLEELRYLRALMNTSLFVMITAESSRTMVLGALECQPDDYITKPITQASLRQRLDKSLIKHQAMLQIKVAIDTRDFHEALVLCDKLIKEQKRYIPDCLRVKAQLYFELENYQDAKKIYHDVLETKPYTWARLGLGKTLLALEEFEPAEAMLKSVIEEDSRYVEAHDLLAELYERQKKTLSAQTATAEATQLSPKSVIRHRKLAQLAEKNNDDDTCIDSHQQAIKWGFDSCHESPQDTFNYARKISENINGENSSDARQKAKQAMKSLERVAKRFQQDSSVTMQAKLVESQLHASQDRPKEANSAVNDARVLYNEIDDPDVNASLDYARALLATNQGKEAEKLLIKLVEDNPDNIKLIEKIDGLTGEPISNIGKKRAGSLTKSGISLYEDKNFEEAINTFNEAVGIYPKHIGLNLNLAQVILAQAKEKNNLHEYKKLYQRCFKQTQDITEGHPQYKRFSYLKKQIEELEANSKTKGKKAKPING